MTVLNCPIRERVAQETADGQSPVAACIAAGLNIAVNDCYRFVKDAEIQYRVRQILNENAEKRSLTRNRINEKWAEMASYDVRDMYDDFGRIKPLSEWPDNLAAALVQVKYSDKFDEYGRSIIESVKFVDRVVVLRDNAKALQMFSDKPPLDAKEVAKNKEAQEIVDSMSANDAAELYRMTLNV